MKTQKRKITKECKHEWEVSQWERRWGVKDGWFGLVGDGRQYLWAKQLYCVKCLKLKTL